MRFIRSLLFNVLFYIWTGLCGLSILILFWFPTSISLRVAKVWSSSTLKMAKLLLGLTHEVLGLEHLSTALASGGGIVACKHQSAWETIVFSSLLENPAIVLKDSLMRIPLFGLFLKKLEMIPVARTKGKGLRALSQMLKQANQAVLQGRPLVIFPEGTRTTPGTSSVYHTGVYTLYQKLGISVVPTGLNSGRFWERRKFCKKPGRIYLILMPPIQPGLNRETFMEKLRQGIEEASRLADQHGRNQNNTHA